MHVRIQSPDDNQIAAAFGDFALLSNTRIQEHLKSIDQKKATGVKLKVGNPRQYFQTRHIRSQVTDMRQSLAGKAHYWSSCVEVNVHVYKILLSSFLQGNSKMHRERRPIIFSKRTLSLSFRSFITLSVLCTTVWKPVLSDKNFSTPSSCRMKWVRSAFFYLWASTFSPQLTGLPQGFFFDFSFSSKIKHWRRSAVVGNKDKKAIVDRYLVAWARIG